jgi:hypothetical protein
MFSFAEHYWLSENQFSAMSILHPYDHFSFYYGDILSGFHACCGNEKKNQKMFISFIQLHFDFLNCTCVLPSPWGVLPAGACRKVALGFLGLLGGWNKH